MRPAIGLICTPPRLTRAQAEGLIGAERGFALARALLEDMVALGREVAWRETGDFSAFTAPAETAAEMAELLPGIALRPQAMEAPGVRLEAAAASLFDAGGAPVVLMEMGAPTLPPALLELLFAALREGAEVACVPATDGGCCALGLARPVPGLLHALPPGPDQRAALQAAAEARGLSFRALQPWHGLQGAEDLGLLEAGLDGLAPPGTSPLPPFLASATRYALRG